MITEKLCDYIMSFETKNNKKDSSISGIYVSELLPIVNRTVEEPKKDADPCPAFKYVVRARQIAERIEKNKSDNIIEDIKILEDRCYIKHASGNMNSVTK